MSGTRPPTGPSSAETEQLASQGYHNPDGSSALTVHRSVPASEQQAPPEAAGYPPGRRGVGGFSPTTGGGPLAGGPYSPRRLRQG